jgi:hypothetical protein
MRRDRPSGQPRVDLRLRQRPVRRVEHRRAQVEKIWGEIENENVAANFSDRVGVMATSITTSVSRDSSARRTMGESAREWTGFELSASISR